MAEIVLELSQWAIPLFLILAPLYALFKGVDVYNVFFPLSVCLCLSLPVLTMAFEVPR